jgi:hypothetical protein
MSSTKSLSFKAKQHTTFDKKIEILSRLSLYYTKHTKQDVIHNENYSVDT